MALDSGMFSQAGLNVQVQAVNGSATASLPSLAAGQVDMAVVVPAPSLYAQAAQGFNAKVVAGIDLPMQGRIGAGYLLVRKELQDSIVQPADLKGRTMEGAVEGSPLSLLTVSAVTGAGLQPGKDVTIGYHVKDPSDFLALVRNNAADVYAVAEPIATQAAQEGEAVKWKGFADLAPWYQAQYLGVSDKFLSNNRAAVEKFLEVYLKAVRQIDSTSGVWTDDLIAKASKLTNTDPEIIKAEGGVPYFDPNGTVSTDSLSKTQDFWVSQNQVKQKVDVSSMVDASVLSDAVQSVGKASP